MLEASRDEEAWRMFTGIVATTTELLGREGDLLRFRCPALRHAVELGSSIAVDGVCLTVVEADPLAFEIVEETRSRTTLGALVVGQRVNLEQSVAPTELLDGGIVLGHVDCIGEVLSPGPSLVVAYDARYAPLLVEKGSIVVNGVALTVVEAGRDFFSVALIPETLRRTNLGDLVPGSRVNLEFDLVGKYLIRRLELAAEPAVAR
jgi:riboflavin synthase